MENFKINKQEFETWVKALRSGDYKQDIGALQTIKGYCCLGVACAVLIPKNEQKLGTYEDLLFGYFPRDQHNAPQWLVYINDKVQELTGNTLGIYNDSMNYTFEMIADLLEKTFPVDSQYFEN